MIDRDTLKKYLEWSIAGGSSALKGAAYSAFTQLEDVPETLARWVGNVLATNLMCCKTTTEFYKNSAWALRLSKGIGATCIIRRCKILNEIFRCIYQEQMVRFVNLLTMSFSVRKRIGRVEELLVPTFISYLILFSCMGLAKAAPWGGGQNIYVSSALFGLNVGLFILGVVVMCVYFCRGGGQKNVISHIVHNYRAYSKEAVPVFIALTLVGLFISIISCFIFVAGYEYYHVKLKIRYVVLASCLLVLVISQLALFIFYVQSVLSKAKIASAVTNGQPLSLSAQSMAELQVWVDNYPSKVFSGWGEIRSLLRVINCPREQLDPEILKSNLFKSTSSMGDRRSVTQSLIEVVLLKG